jgi:hypothetical protein
MHSNLHYHSVEIALHCIFFSCNTDSTARMQNMQICKPVWFHRLYLTQVNKHIKWIDKRKPPLVSNMVRVVNNTPSCYHRPEKYSILQTEITLCLYFFHSCVCGFIFYFFGSGYIAVTSTSFVVAFLVRYSRFADLPC